VETVFRKCVEKGIGNFLWKTSEVDEVGYNVLGVAVFVRSKFCSDVREIRWKNGIVRFFLLE